MHFITKRSHTFNLTVISLLYFLNACGFSQPLQPEIVETETGLELCWETELLKYYAVVESTDLNSFTFTDSTAIGDGSMVEIPLSDILGSASDKAFFRIAEFEEGSPFDTDSDNLPTWWEIKFDTDYLTSNADANSDADGLDNLAEYVAGTDPTNSDSDNDGTPDDVELDQGSSPIDGSDEGLAPLDPLAVGLFLSTALGPSYPATIFLNVISLSLNEINLTTNSETLAAGTSIATNLFAFDVAEVANNNTIYSVQLSLPTFSNDSTGATFRDFSFFANASRRNASQPYLLVDEGYNINTGTFDGIGRFLGSANTPYAEAYNDYRALIVPIQMSGIHHTYEGRIPLAFVNKALQNDTFGIFMENQNTAERYGTLNLAAVTIYPSKSAIPEGTTGALYWIDGDELHYSTTFSDSGVVTVEYFFNGIPIGTEPYTLLPVEFKFYRPEPVKDSVPWDLTKEEREISDSEIEEKGIWLRANQDDDNDNGTGDSAETGAVNDENDLLEFELKLDLPDGVDLVVKKSPELKIWANDDKTGEVAGSGTEVVVPTQYKPTRTYYLEAIGELEDGELEFLIRPSNGSDSSIKTFTVNTYKSLAVCLSGEVFNQSNPSQWNPSALSQGTYDICEDLYLKGYNISYYAEPHVTANGSNEGQGSTYDEVLAQAEHGGVDKVLVFGYSHGGSATRQLLSAIGGRANFVWSGYIDAIDRNSIGSETRYPAPSSKHWNNYQKNTVATGGFLNGDKVTGAYPGAGGIDVSAYTVGGLRIRHADDFLGHTGIEKHPTVQADIITEIEGEL